MNVNEYFVRYELYLFATQVLINIAYMYCQEMIISYLSLITKNNLNV